MPATAASKVVNVPVTEEAVAIIEASFSTLKSALVRLRATDKNVEPSTEQALVTEAGGYKLVP